MESAPYSPAMMIKCKLKGFRGASMHEKYVAKTSFCGSNLVAKNGKILTWLWYYCMHPQNDPVLHFSGCKLSKKLPQVVLML